MAGIAIKIQELDDKLLEDFIDIWVDGKSGLYHRVESLGKANDKGRDVVGFVTDDLHEGAWDLFQCKRKTRGGKLGIGEFIGELGKVFYHHSTGTYKTMPRQFWFVAPRGVTGPVQDLLLNRSDIGTRLIAAWDEYCRTTITKKSEIALSDDIRQAIESYDFKKVDYYTAARLAKDPAARPALSKLLGLPPDEAPEGHVPDTIAQTEIVYLNQLRLVYEEEAGSAFDTLDDILVHPDHGEHLRLQRTRFFEAAAFDRFHRDNTAPGAVETFKKDIYHTLIEVYQETHPSNLKRLNAVMKHLGIAQVTLLGRPSRAPVRQGMCHHLVTDGKLKWTR